MADIDMIPREYRDGVRVRHTMRLTAVALAVIVTIGALGGIALRWRSGALERAATALQASATQAQADLARDAALQAGRIRREQDASVLRALRRKGELAALAQGLNAALTDQVWLTALSIDRDIQALSPSQAAASMQDPAVNATVENITTLGATPAAAGETWRLSSAIDITGQATSYGAVTAFLSALARQSGIANLRLVASTTSVDGRAVDFSAAAALLRPGAGQGTTH